MTRQQWITCIKRNYSLSIEQWDSFLLRSVGRCMICINDFKNVRDCHTDHDHQSGRVRGLLCHDCNVALTWVERGYIGSWHPNYSRWEDMVDAGATTAYATQSAYRHGYIHTEYWEWLMQVLNYLESYPHINKVLEIFELECPDVLPNNDPCDEVWNAAMALNYKQNVVLKDRRFSK